MAREKGTELCFQLQQGLGRTGRFPQVSQAQSCWKGPLQGTQGLRAAFGSSPPTLRPTPAQRSQAASVSVHPTVHAKGWEGWEGWEGRLGRKAGKDPQPQCQLCSPCSTKG